jgi:hypothetical protein
MAWRRVSRSSAWITRLWGTAWVVLTAWLGLAGSDVTPTGAAAVEPLAVEWGHCTTVTQGSAQLCRYDPADPLRLWIDHPLAAEARVRIDGVVVATEPYSLPEEPEGQGLRVTLPSLAHASRATGRQDTIRNATQWSYSLEAPRPAGYQKRAPRSDAHWNALVSGPHRPAPVVPPSP